MRLFVQSSPHFECSKIWRVNLLSAIFFFLFWYLFSVSVHALFSAICLGSYCLSVWNMLMAILTAFWSSCCCFLGESREQSYGSLPSLSQPDMMNSRHQFQPGYSLYEQQQEMPDMQSQTSPRLTETSNLDSQESAEVDAYWAEMSGKKVSRIAPGLW